MEEGELTKEPGSEPGILVAPCGSKRRLRIPGAPGPDICRRGEASAKGEIGA